MHVYFEASSQGQMKGQEKMQVNEVNKESHL